MLNVLYVKKTNIYRTYISKNILNHGEKLHYLALKKLSALLKGITPKQVGDFYCLNYFHLSRTKNKLESHKKYVEIKMML